MRGERSPRFPRLVTTPTIVVRSVVDDLRVVDVDPCRAKGMAAGHFKFNDSRGLFRPAGIVGDSVIQNLLRTHWLRDAERPIPADEFTWKDAIGNQCSSLAMLI